MHEGRQGNVDVADEQNGEIKAPRGIGWAVPAAAQTKREISSGDRKRGDRRADCHDENFWMLCMCKDNRRHFFLYKTTTKKKLGNT